MERPSMELDELMSPIPVLNIGIAKNVVNTIYAPQSVVVRVCATENASLWCHPAGKPRTGDGLLLPADAVEYFSVKPGYVIEVAGVVNISEEY